MNIKIRQASREAPCKQVGIHLQMDWQKVVKVYPIISSNNIFACEIVPKSNR